MCLYLYGCLEFKSIEQPSSVLPGELFTVLIEVTVVETGGEGPWEHPIFGICLPMGWTIPGDTIEFTGACQGSITYDPDISLEQESISPAPEGYYWWLGSGSVGDPAADAVFAEVPIQADLQPGRYSLDYLLDSGYLHDAHGGPRLLYELSDAERSDQHVIEVVDEWTPRELNALPRGSSVVLTWLPPLEKEGLAGYRVYRNGELVYTLPAETTEILDEDLAVDAVYLYWVSAVYSDAAEQLTPYIEVRIFSGGSGEPNDPYQLALADQLLYLADHRHLWDKAYVLVNDIDLHPDQTPRAPFSQAVIHRFAGIFDGNDHAISNLMITGGSHLGLFGCVESSAQVLDLNVIDVNTIGSGNFVGGLAGDNDGLISGCHATGIVNGNGSTGGLVGVNIEGSITNCYSTGAVSGEDYVGGLVGENVGSITNSYGAGTVSGGYHVGGLVGFNDDGSSINNCNSPGAVSGIHNVGGLVGHNHPGSSIASSYSTGSVSGNDSVGGLVGECENEGSITTSYSTGTVSGDYRVGGLVGENAGSITASYSTGSVNGNRSVGGLVGWNRGDNAIVNTCFWDVQTSGRTNMCGLQEEGATGCDDSSGLTSAEMQTAATFLNAGWDFIGETGNGTEEIWWILEGQDYPRLWWELISEN
jgi:hypothetical protein